MKAYLEILEEVITTGVDKSNRTGTGTKSRFSMKFRHDMRNGFPLLTTKKVNFKAVAGELMGFLSGATTVAEFERWGCKIWNPWGLEADDYSVSYYRREELAEQYAKETGIETDEALSRLDEADAELESIKAQIEEKKRTYGEDINLFYSDTSIQELLLAQQTAGSSHLLRQAKISLTYRNVHHPEGYLGPIYGKQWIEWRTSMGDVINQLKNVADQLANFPDSRRILFTGYNPEHTPRNRYISVGAHGRPVKNSSDAVQAAILDGKQALPPCHLMTIFNVEPPRKGSVNPTLNLHTLMRSTDVPIGLPFNIASYGLLLELICNQFGYDAGELVIEMVDCHVYTDQIELAKEQLLRTPTALPKLNLPTDLGFRFEEPSTFTDERFERILSSLTDYNPQAFIKYPVAV